MPGAVAGRNSSREACFESLPLQFQYCTTCQCIEGHPHPQQKKSPTCHGSRGSYALKVCESPFILQKGKGFFIHTTPHFMAYFGAICFANMGGGSCRNRFQKMF